MVGCFCVVNLGCGRKWTQIILEMWVADFACGAGRGNPSD